MKKRLIEVDGSLGLWELLEAEKTNLLCLYRGNTLYIGGYGASLQLREKET